MRHSACSVFGALLIALLLQPALAQTPPQDIEWPPNDGCSAPAQSMTIAAGTLIDRFGSERGTFVSPRGESYASRALPYVCEQLNYHVYRVDRPLPAMSCKAAPWFGQPGGAVQMKLSAHVDQLEAGGALTPVLVALGPNHGIPQCKAP